MKPNHHSDKKLLRAEIAAVAARLVVEDGADYGTAKRKATKQILGHVRVGTEIQPDNIQIENEVRMYNDLFSHGIQPVRNLFLQKLALQVMKELEQFTPYLTGAVLNGTAGEHSNIHILVFPENPKDIEIFLINQNIKFEISKVLHLRNPDKIVEILSFTYCNEDIYLTVFEKNDLKRIIKKSVNPMKYGTITNVQTLIVENQA